MYRIPEHFVLVNGNYPYDKTTVGKRGGYIDRVSFTVVAVSDFSSKFGKKVKALEGTYSTCRGSGYYGNHRQVRLPWGGQKAAALLEALIRHHWSEKEKYIQVEFHVGNEYYEAYVESQGMSAKEMVKLAVKRVNERLDDPDVMRWRTPEEAQAYIDEKRGQVKQADLVREQKREVQADLIKAFNDAGFPTMSLTDLSFDVKTSKRLIEFLQEPLDV